MAFAWQASGWDRIIFLLGLLNRDNRMPDTGSQNIPLIPWTQTAHWWPVTNWAGLKVSVLKFIAHLDTSL